MKRVISFCLWGTDPRYWRGAIRNAQRAQDLYPGWICRFYVVREGRPTAWFDELAGHENCEVLLRDCPPDAACTLLRFEAIDDPEVEVMLSRDTDSRLCVRERAAVDEWLASSKGFHVMRDHPNHDACMLAGMWGMRTRRDLRITPLIAAYLGSRERPYRWGIDQDFLREVLWPIAYRDCLCHDPIFDRRPFPSEERARDDVYFVAESFGADDTVLYPANRASLDAFLQHPPRRALRRMLGLSYFYPRMWERTRRLIKTRAEDGNSTLRAALRVWRRLRRRQLGLPASR